MEKEVRYMTTEIRSDGDDAEKKAAGLGIVYDQWEELWPGYKERIVKGAVKRDSVVKSFFNHEPSQVLSTTKSKPALELNDTDKGLEYVSPIPPTSYGKDLEINLERGNVKGSSFAFSVPQDGSKRWEEDGVFYREIKKLILYEIGPVTDPAYLKTSASLRTAEDIYKEFLASKSQADEEAREQQEDGRKASQAAAECRNRELQLLELEVS
jgi:uncharacterized protein